MEKDLLSTAEAAEVLGIKEQTLRKWRKNKKYDIPTVPMGRLVKYSRRHLQEFIDRQAGQNQGEA